MEAATTRTFATLRWLRLASFLTLVAAGAILLLIRLRHPAGEALPELPRRFQLPEFTLSERGGGKLALADLRGKVWVADFIFTSCSSTCPQMTTQMARLQEAIRGFMAADLDRIRLVSFSVDGKHDTPERLAQFAKGYGADPALWSFATGADGEVMRLAEDFFKLTAQRNPQGSPGDEFLHSTKFILVDAQGFVRGIYEAVNLANQNALNPILRDMRRLLSEN